MSVRKSVYATNGAASDVLHLCHTTDWMLIALTELTRLFIRIMSLVVTSFSVRLKPRRRKLTLRRRRGKC